MVVGPVFVALFCVMSDMKDAVCVQPGLNHRHLYIVAVIHGFSVMAHLDDMRHHARKFERGRHALHRQ
jgi:hypothetical protein